MSTPHRTSRTGYSFELVVRQIPHPSPVTLEQREANRTPPIVSKRFPTIRARTIDAARREAHRVLEEAGYTIRSVAFAAGGQIAAVVEAKREKRGPQLPLSRLKR